MDQRLSDTTDFPRNGFRARRWLRFERDLDAWLTTPEGRFAKWCARRQIERSGEPLGARLQRPLATAPPSAGASGTPPATDRRGLG